MNLPSTLLLLFSLYYHSALAGYDTLRNAGIVVNVNPSTLLDVYNGISLRMGVEHVPERHFSFGVDGGVYLYWPHFTRGYTIVPQLKYYFKNSGSYNEHVREYVSLQYGYKDRGYIYEDSVEAINGMRLDSRFRMRQFVNSFTIHYGGIDHRGRRWMFDYYVGAGVRLVYSTSDLDPNYRVYDYYDWTADLIYYPKFSTGMLTYPTVCLGLKIGYKMGKPE